MKYFISKYMKKCYDNGWISPRDGNISFRKRNSFDYYISPGGIRKHEMDDDDVLKLDLFNNKIIENYGDLKPSGEIILHNLILKDDRYIHQDLCVIHCHPPHILAFIGMLKSNRELNYIREIFPEIDNRIKIGKNVDFIQARTPKLGETVYQNILDNSIVALKRHGVVSIGNTFENAMENIETIEYYCKIFLMEK